jgi:hypothetical protein
MLSKTMEINSRTEGVSYASYGQLWPPSRIRNAGVFDVLHGNMNKGISFHTKKSSSQSNTSELLFHAVRHVLTKAWH